MTRRTMFVIAAFAVACALIVGWWAGLVAASLGVVAERFGSPRLLLGGAVIVMLLTPVMWLLSNLFVLDALSPAVVTNSPWPSRAVIVVLMAATLALVLEEGTDR